VFDEVGMEALIYKRNKITAYLEFILQEISKEVNGCVEIMTSSYQEERGCQLSVWLHGEGDSLFDYLMKNGVITDWREPNVIRLAPVPVYYSFDYMYNFGQLIKKVL
jgi:kynureninase